MTASQTQHESPSSPHLVASHDEQREDKPLPTKEDSRPGDGHFLRVTDDVQPTVKATADQISHTQAVDDAFAEAGSVAGNNGSGKIAYVLEAVGLSGFCPDDSVASCVLESRIGTGSCGKGSW